MSNSRIIPRGQARAAKAWRPGDLDAAPRAAAPQPAAPPPPPEPSAEELQRAELARLRAAAWEEGHAAGLAEGRAAGEREVAQMRELLASLRELLADVEQGIASDVLSLALEVAKQMVRQALRVKPELVFAIIREAALSFPELAPNPRLVLNPADALLVREALAPEMRVEEIPWKIVEDAAVERGGCRFQNGASDIDASLENRWRRVVAALGRDDAWLDLNL